MGSNEYRSGHPLADAEVLRLIADLKPEQIEEIDALIMRTSDHHWRKMAFVVGMVMGMLPQRVRGIPDIYYARRVARLVEQGQLESRGDLSRMRYCEVRIPSSDECL